MRLAAYLRVSTDRQAEEGFGLDVQREAIERWAESSRHCVGTWCRDEGVSGTLAAEERPGLVEALALVREQAVAGIVVARLDRLARTLTVQEAVLETVWRCGGVVFAADTGEVQQDDPDDPMRTFVRQVMGAAAQLDRAMIAARLRAGRRLKAERGGFAYGSPPYGWQAVDGELVPVPEEQEALAMLARMRDERASLRAMADALTQAGYRPKRSDRWHPATVGRILRRMP